MYLLLIWYLSVGDQILCTMCTMHNNKLDVLRNMRTYFISLLTKSRFSPHHNPFDSWSSSLVPPNPSKDIGPRPSTRHLTYHSQNACHLTYEISNYMSTSCHQEPSMHYAPCIHLCNCFWRLQFTEIAFHVSLHAIQRSVGWLSNHRWFINIAMYLKHR
jgi:hypothetical protein